jgi:ATP-binding cassette subfamily B protein
MSFLSGYRNFRLFLGPRVWFYFVITVFFGLFWFLVDLSFIYVIQIFLVSLGLFQKSQTLISLNLDLQPIHGVIFLSTFGLLRSGLLMVRTYVTGMLAQEFGLIHRARIYNRALIDPNFDRSASEVFALFSERISGSCNVITNMGQLLITSIAISLYATMGFYFSPFIFLIGIFFFALFLTPLSWINRLVKISGEGITKSANSSYDVLMLGIKNKTFLRLTNMVRIEANKGISFLNITYSHYQTYHLWGSLKNGLPMFIGTVVISLLTFIGTVYFKTPAIELISLFYVFIRLGQMTSDANAFRNEIRFNYPSFQELHHFSSEYDQTVSVSKELEFREVNKIELIEFKNISFGYDDKDSIIRNLSLKLTNGDLLLIKGPSGMGKSTLLALMTGLVKPNSGHVLVNNIDINSYATDFREKVGYVGPESFMIPGSLRENLLYGNKQNNIEEDEIYTAVKKAGCLDFIEKLPNMLDYKLSEQTQFSTGQKQRLAFARAILREPELFIFDEATANLDAETESKIIDIVRELSSNKIIVVISHKDSFDSLAKMKLEFTKNGITKSNHSQKVVTPVYR